MKPSGILALVLCCSSFLEAADAPVVVQQPPAKKRTFRLDLSLEDKRDGKFKVEFKADSTRPVKGPLVTVEDLVPGAEEITLPDIPDGKYHIYFSSPGHAQQWRVLTLDDRTKEPVELKVQLLRKRYAVIRYVFNPSGGRELSGKGLIEGRAAVAHWGRLPYFEHDWQLWQKPGVRPSDGNKFFGDTLYLEFHRQSLGFGFIEAPKGVAFDELKEAPAGEAYQSQNMKATKGLTLFCRVNGNRQEGLGYGKIMVEEVTETPPVGIKVLERQ